jgi:hypothetical protein
VAAVAEMSASAVFELHSQVSEEEIRKQLQALWDTPLGFGYQADVSADSAVGYCVDLRWFFGDAREDERARRVIDYLLEISSDGSLHYLRDPSSFVRGSDPDYSRPISVDEVFHSEFRPSMSDGIQYRYLVQR